jgi:FkbM family methyltransferase
MDFITLNHLGGLVYIDGGAFDGDTIEAFLEQNIAFDQIYALEPDVTNFKKLEKKISALPKQIAQKITCLNKALWKEEGVVSFNQTGNVASMISDHGSNKADTITIDHILKKKNTIIKLDIEGAEISVLKSSLPILEKLTPILAISVYHNPNDLLDIFDLLVAIDCDYKFFLRCHGYDGMDLVLYAVPLTFVSEVKSYEN